MSFLKRFFSKESKLENFPPIKDVIGKGRYVFVYLYSSECAVCSRTTPMVEEMESDYGTTVDVLQLVVDSFPEKQLKKHGIMFTPTLCMIDPKGEVVHRSVGLIDRQKLEGIFAKTKEV